MGLVYLDGAFVESDEAKISPMNRGFLFGEGVYEVIPSYGGQCIGLKPHLERLRTGLRFLQIDLDYNDSQWLAICNTLIASQSAPNVAIYIQVTRGSFPVRFHGFNDNSEPTVFAYAFNISKTAIADKAQTKAFNVALSQDMRWKHCNIKSTSLLGNVMHFQHGYQNQKDETILFNDKEQITEASSSNVFIVKGQTIATPPLDNQILPGITRLVLLDLLRKYTNYTIEERIITLNELLLADEVWLTSSTKEVVPVTTVAEQVIGHGEIGDVWLEAQTLFSTYKFDY